MAVTEGSVQVPPDSTGKIIDTNELTRAAQTVERQNISIADPETDVAIAAVVNVGSYALQTVRPTDWSVKHVPAAATQATISKAAGAAGVQHVCTSLMGVISTVGTAQTVLVLNLRDGASGAGTIVWSQQFILPVNTTLVIAQSNLNIIGTAATAMTLEFSAAGVADSVCSVSMTGYTITAP